MNGQMKFVLFQVKRLNLFIKLKFLNEIMEREDPDLWEHFLFDFDI